MNSRAQRLVAAGVAVALVLAMEVGAQTIDTNKYAILAEGPREGRGIDSLQPNVIPFWYATYLVAGETIELYYVDGRITSSFAWPLIDCPLRALRSTGGNLFYHENAEGWSVLFRLVDRETAGADSASSTSIVCAFADRFIDRFLYFKRTIPVSDPSLSAPPLPAIVELN